MIKLTDTQTLTLTRASARPGNLALPLPRFRTRSAFPADLGRRGHDRARAS